MRAGNNRLGLARGRGRVSTKRRHAMPFGAQLLDQGGVRFRLWAPNARTVDLLLEDGRGALTLDALGDGWFELVTDRAGHGSRYRYRIDETHLVPDPASRYNPEDVDGPSQVWDPDHFDWRDTEWRGRPWEDAVIYELHVGAFSTEGTFEGVKHRLDYLQQLGVTAIELMPVADFPGRRNWGYDGVLPFAPDSTYGTPDDLKSLVRAAHSRGIMVLLDVVYNHFGPQGNYLGLYAKPFFTERHRTPWGAAINFDDRDSRTVRDFFVHNALYWLQEFNLDGLRFDAVHAIADESEPDILDEIAARVRETIGPGRHVHLILENDKNIAHYLQRDPLRYTAQWNDDVHHALHVLLTNERDSYYADYADQPLRHLGRCLAEGFAYQGEHSGFRDKTRGEPSASLPATAFVNFLQNHDQIGNRAFGERLNAIVPGTALRAATTILLLAPQPPLLFMGEEFAAATPFLFFCDYTGDLAQAVRDGRRQEFERFPAFRDPALRERIPDPNDVTTFTRSRIDWNWETPQSQWFDYVNALLDLRRREIVPRLHGMRGHAGRAEVRDNVLHVTWRLGDGSELAVIARLERNDAKNVAVPSGRLLAASDDRVAALLKKGELPKWSAAWFLLDGNDPAT
jgi:malto-oligosyltrehalose trehalohydrolase